MRLVSLVMEETKVAAERIMLLRHSKNDVVILKSYGVPVEDYTCVQPILSKYDYWHPDKPRIDVVIVIFEDKVYGVYRIVSVEKEGPVFSLITEPHRQFEIKRKRPDKPARRFKMIHISSTAIGMAITGWSGGRTRTPVQRSDGKFFYEIEVNIPVQFHMETELAEQFDENIWKAANDDPSIRQKRLANAPTRPLRIEARTIIFARNPDVVVEVLLRAKGHCESCRKTAPFNRRSDGTPYLEVHHLIRLADDGDDTVENAVALCPIGHRQKHYA